MDGGFIFDSEPGTYKHVNLIDDHSMLPNIGEELYSHIAKTHSGTSRLGWIVIFQAIRGNYTYMKFPKKARRKLKKSVRRHKNLHIRPVRPMIFETKAIMTCMNHIYDVRRRVYGTDC